GLASCSPAKAGVQIGLGDWTRLSPGSRDAASILQQPRHLVEQLARQETDAADLLRKLPPGLAVQIDAPKQGGERSGAAGGEAADDPRQRVARARRGKADAAALEAKGAAVGSGDIAVRPLDQGRDIEADRRAAGGVERIGFDLLRLDLEQPCHLAR